MRRRRMQNRVSAVLMAVALLGLTACGSVSRPEPGGDFADETTWLLTMGTGDTDSHMYLAGAAVAKKINDTVTNVRVGVEPSKGSPVNVTNLMTGEIELGLVAGDVAYAAYNGTAVFEGEKQENLRVIAACYPSVSSWIALGDSGFSYVHDLRGKSVTIGPQSSASEMTANEVLAVMGMDDGSTTIENMGLNEGAAAVGDGTIDAAHSFGVLPLGEQQALAGEKAVRFLKYTDEELEQILAANPAYCQTVIPAGTYPGQEEDIPSFGVKALLCVNAELDEELAYELAKALAAGAPDLASGHAFMSAMREPEFFCEELPIPLHPGAEKYYREAGYIRQEGE